MGDVWNIKGNYLKLPMSNYYAITEICSNIPFSISNKIYIVTENFGKSL